MDTIRRSGWLAASLALGGCTTIHEQPNAPFAAQPDRSASPVVVPVAVEVFAELFAGWDRMPGMSALESPTLGAGPSLVAGDPIALHWARAFTLEADDRVIAWCPSSPIWE